MAQQKIFFGRTNDLVYSLIARGEYFVHIAGTEERAPRKRRSRRRSSS
jgi:hypothetical protein